MSPQPAFKPLPDQAFTLPYSRLDGLDTSDLFNLAQCVRRRMTANVTDYKRWRRENLSFHSYVSKIQPLESEAFYDRD